MILTFVKWVQQHAMSVLHNHIVRMQSEVPRLPKCKLDFWEWQIARYLQKFNSWEVALLIVLKTVLKYILYLVYELILKWYFIHSSCFFTSYDIELSTCMTIDSFVIQTVKGNVTWNRNNFLTSLKVYSQLRFQHFYIYFCVFSFL